ncbi:MAG: hypothetical protein AAF564_07865 [Bacteroidota bacterium]
MAEDTTLEIDCAKHGKRPVTVICRHLLEGKDGPLGFIETSTVPRDLQAWCNACEALFELEGSLTDAFKAFHDMALVCESCYIEIKLRHTVV